MRRLFFIFAIATACTGESLQPGAAPDAGAVDSGASSEGPRDAGPEVATSTVCGPTRPFFEGPLCGDERPCVVAVEETVAVAPVQGEMPALALDASDQPIALYAVTDGTPSRAVIARRDDGGWRAEFAPFTLSRGAIAFADDVITVLASEHSLNRDWTRVWRREFGTWREGPALDVLLLERVGIHVDDAGCLHTIGRAPDPWRLVHARRHATHGWEEIDTGLNGIGNFAIARDGTLYIAFQSGPTLDLWPRQAGTSGPIVFEGDNIDHARVVAVDTPTLIYNRLHRQDVWVPSIDFARPSGAAWDIRTLSEGDGTGWEHCTRPPTTAGEVCRRERTEQVLLDTVASGRGDVRVLSASTRVIHDLITDCRGPEGCRWWGGDIEREVELQLLAPDSAEATTVVSGADIRAAAARVDRRGRIHVLAHVAVEAGIELRYWLLTD